MQFITAAALLRITIALLLAALLILWPLARLTHMPGKSHSGPLPPLAPHEIELSRELRRTVELLAGSLGERNYIYSSALLAAAELIEHSFRETGLRVQRQAYDINGSTYYNIEAEKPGSGNPDKIITIGAHYDSVAGSPGANDNGSGIAALLALARLFAVRSPSLTIRFVAFANEEPPFFYSKNMGSYVYAERCRHRGEEIVAMLSLETIGYYTDRPGSQRYPFPLGFFYPSQGNFIGFVSNLSSRELLNRSISAFRRHTRFPSEGGALPWFVPGIFWSDHWPFWKMGYQAIMVTDTALFRYPYYHSPEDTPDKLDYESMARVITGLEHVITELAAAPAAALNG